MTELVGTLAGAAFSFHTDLPALAEYASLHFGPLRGKLPELPQVVATLRWHDGQPPGAAFRRSPELAQMERVDRDLYRQPGELRWFRVDDLRDLFLRIRLADGRLEIEGDFYYRLGNSRLSDTIRRARQWRNLDRMMQRRFPTLLAYLVYYPCWWWLERTVGVHPIHAGAVATASGVILLAGASGVGKSTLAIALAAEPGAALLSDSFVLHRGVEVLPVREPILLDAWSQRWLGDRAALLQPLGRGYGLQRFGFHVVGERASDGGRAALLIFPRRAPEPFVRQVSGDLAHRWLSAGDMMINDLRRYWAYAAVLEQLDPCGLMLRRENELAHLTGAVRCAEVGIAPTMSADDAVASVWRLLAGADSQAASGRGAQV